MAPCAMVTFDERLRQLSELGDPLDDVGDDDSLDGVTRDTQSGTCHADAYYVPALLEYPPRV